MGAPNVQIPIVTALVKELSIKGSFRYGVSLAIISHQVTDLLLARGLPDSH
jgi:hypothetical protein